MTHKDKEEIMKKFDLQFFAGDEEETEEKKEVKMLTEEEAKALAEKEADRRATKAIQTAKEKWEKEFQEKLAKEKELAQLSAEERKAKEFEEQQKQFEVERKTFVKEKLTLQAEKDMISKGLPSEFASLMIGSNAEETLSNINTFEQTFRKAVEQAVEEKIKGKTPKSGTTETEYNPFNKETFNLSEQGRLYRENPAEAERLRKVAK